MAEPDVLLLDEPTAMLDEEGGRTFWRAVAYFQQRCPQTPILHASHDEMPEDFFGQVWTVTQRGVQPATSVRSDSPQAVVSISENARKAEELWCGSGLAFVPRGRVVFSDVDLAVHRGGCTVLAGANGSGKSTLVDVLLGLRRPDRGEIRCLPGLRRAALLQFSDECLLGRTVQDELTLSAGRSLDRGETARLLALGGLEEFAARDPFTLSGGEKRRLLITCLFATGAPLLVADEPFAGLDAASRVCVESLLRQAMADGRAVVITANRSSEMPSFPHVCVELSPVGEGGSR
jgi:energy-coupling factor transport system ATP-binding protein